MVCLLFVVYQYNLILQASLTLDPSVLLPGGSGPRKKVEPGRALEGAASFEEPVQNPVLHSVSKVGQRLSLFPVYSI